MEYGTNPTIRRPHGLRERVLVCGGGNGAHVLVSLLGREDLNNRYEVTWLTLYKGETERLAAAGVQPTGDRGVAALGIPWAPASNPALHTSTGSESRKGDGLDPHCSLRHGGGHRQHMVIGAASHYAATVEDAFAHGSFGMIMLCVPSPFHDTYIEALKPALCALSARRRPIVFAGMPGMSGFDFVRQCIARLS